jgi:inorganic pyrophosphatase
MPNLLHLPQHKKFPEIAKAIVEIPKDTNTKYEYDAESGLVKLDRCLISSLQYPASYGFLPNTLADDGDPVDVLIYNTVPLVPLSLVEVKIVGALMTYDHGKKDYKILGVPTYNPNNYNDIDDLDPMFLTVCGDFFRLYKKVNRKPNPVKIKGWINHKDAQNYIKDLLISS